MKLLGPTSMMPPSTQGQRRRSRVSETFEATQDGAKADSVGARRGQSRLRQCSALAPQRYRRQAHSRASLSGSSNSVELALRAFGYVSTGHELDPRPELRLQ